MTWRCWLGFHAWHRLDCYIGRGLLYCRRCGRLEAEN
jgi:hypothetical protein